MLIPILNYFMKSGLPAESGRIAISNPKLVLRQQPRSGTVKALSLAVLTCLMRTTNL